MRFLLASKSPRRIELLSRLDAEVQVVSVDVDETLSPTLPPTDYCTTLARRKAAAVPEAMVGEADVVVGADTIVYYGGQILGKPNSTEQARQMLQRLSGNRHSVYTGVCLRTKSNTRWFCERTEVQFNPITSAQIDYYITHYPPLDKAGAYGIQDWMGMVAVERIEGCYYNVMGLPVPRLYALLTDMLR